MSVAPQMPAAPSAHPASAYRGTFDLLGGSIAARRLPRSPVELHALLAKGLPSRALLALSRGFTVVDSAEWLVNAVSISPRTFARIKAAPARHLAPDMSDRVWRSTQILSRAVAAFGTRRAAEEWLVRPATALDRQRPIDLLSTTAGLELVSDVLGRLEYGVYT